ncbi:receptor activity-modifying protein 3 isoform X5 [Anas acuta]|uniref:receptor activity-modifying protein 3 isoform X5 n=1 Tax=Anas platyrhynchos TaxID=8839 RepID=UPI000F7C4BE2|nr:receptor activity-modifying protein 3 isoform X5 [Anas platyrhynchos]|eukprot:XP_027307102.1 receptor activity-modifying protein 3 isoform X7 [Anas platyrhynchos]
MEAPGCCRRHLPVLLLWVNGLMTLGLAGEGLAGAHQQTRPCNESLMLEKLPACGKYFEEMMKKVDSKKWCNLTEFIKQFLHACFSNGSTMNNSNKINSSEAKFGFSCFKLDVLVVW